MTEDLRWETLDTRTSYACPGFDVVTDQVRLPDGTEAAFDYLLEGESVVILPFTTEDEVVVIEEWRHAVDRVNRGLPAGCLEAGEDPVDACHRELAEETGYEAGEVEHLTSVEPVNGMADSVFHYYVARDCTPTAERDLDENESIAVDTTTWAALVAAAREDRLRDGRSMLGVCHYALFGEE